MKKLSFILILIVFEISAQTPQGRLFLHLSTSLPGRLCYVDFSIPSLIVVDTVEISDMIRLNNTLYTAGYDIFAYNLLTLQKIDTIPGVSAARLAKWNNKLVVLTSIAPYFRVYDSNNNNLLFSVNTNKIPVMPNDVTVLSDKAYLVYDTTLQIVDLLLQDTLSTLHTPHPFIFGGMNFFVFSALNEVYIDVEYATGAPRFSLLKLNQQNMCVDTVFHQEMAYNPTKPIILSNNIYLAHFLSYYNVITDTLIMAAFNSNFIVDCDPQTNLLFMYNSQNYSISTYINNTFPQTINLSGWLNKALFVPTIPIEIPEKDEENQWIQIFPNPVSDILYIKINRDFEYLNVTLYDPSGKCVLKKVPDMHQETLKIDTGKLDKGVYFLIIRLDNDFKVKKLIKIPG